MLASHLLEKKLVSRAFSTVAGKTSSLLLKSTENGVTTLTMNNPKRLNGWTGAMMTALRDNFKDASVCDKTKAVILTGADPYYCAGVDLSATIRPMHPQSLYNDIIKHNQGLFEIFLDMPKPIIAAGENLFVRFQTFKST